MSSETRLFNLTSMHALTTVNFCLRSMLSALWSVNLDQQIVATSLMVYISYGTVVDFLMFYIVLCYFLHEYIISYVILSEISTRGLAEVYQA